ncbi:unconventional myosin-va-like [Plakobranchus ocellatus]|uniref:Unconventional myosin-va-like n=1 Tax=Plakobranchus ocellatus TaxID=259542 RepID=A0AAV4C459_9GAST|nr:unconventional myosin-va-like [Plakobranchus ocellatus]
MDRLRNFWGKKEETSVLSESQPNTEGSIEHNVQEGTSLDFPQSADDNDEETGSLDSTEMTDSFTSGLKNAVSSSRRPSQSELSFQTASTRGSQSDVSDSFETNPLDLSFLNLSSRRSSQSTFPSTAGSRRSSQSNFPSAAGSRRSSQSDFGYAGAVVKGASQSGVGRRYSVASFDPYKRFDLQFVAFNKELSNFYVKGARVWIPDADRVWRAAELLEDYTGQTTLKIQYEEAEVGCRP